MAQLRASLSVPAETLADQLLQFWTRHGDDPRGKVRTHGIVLHRRLPGRVDPARLAALAPGSSPRHAAHGKVVVMKQDDPPLVSCYQVSEDRADASRVACYNGVLAAAGLLADAGRLEATLRVQLPAGVEVEVSARLMRSTTGSASVTQRWMAVPLTVERISSRDGLRLAWSAGAMNDYVLVACPSAERLRAFSPEDAQRIWHDQPWRERRPLRGRILATWCDEDGTVWLRAFTCSKRRHPSAPPTGLAVLAVAAARLDWLPPGTRHVRTLDGDLALPDLRQGPRGYQFDFSQSTVSLEPIDEY
ncbi:MAG: hypothetical protein AAGE01_06635 [Pseudomonadota bacterium]